MTARLHIVVVPDWYPSPENPVAGIFVRDQAEAIAELHDVTVLAPPSPLAPPEVVEGPLRTVRLRPSRGRGPALTIGRLHALDRALRELERQRRPDLLHAHVFSMGFLTVLEGRRRGLPVVLSEHYTDVQERRLGRRQRVIARYAYRHADLVCPVSNLLEQSILELEPRAQTHVVPNVVDVDTFARAGQARPSAPAPGGRILAVAGLARYKGLPYLIDALSLLVAEQPGVSLDIVGDGPDRATLEAQSAGLPVRFLGQRPREEVAALMARSDVLVLSSLVETFGIAAVEGLAAGMGVVVTDACGVADVVAENGGRVVPVGDPAALTKALTDLLQRSGPDARRAVETLRARFGAHGVSQTWDALYRSLVLDRRG